MKYEYKVVPAPRKGEKARGVKGIEGRFAHALMRVMNEMGAEGWEYQRADTLPCDSRSGLTGKSTSFQNMLVFRRQLEAEIEQPEEVVDQDPLAAEPPAPPRVEEIAATHAPALSAVTVDEEDDNHAPEIGPADPPKNADEVAAQ